MAYRPMAYNIWPMACMAYMTIWLYSCDCCVTSYKTRECLCGRYNAGFADQLVTRNTYSQYGIGFAGNSPAMIVARSRAMCCPYDVRSAQVSDPVAAVRSVLASRPCFIGLTTDL